jgi:hypothetical protein
MPIKYWGLGKGTCMIDSFHLADRLENSRLPSVVGSTAISPVKHVDCRWATQHGVKQLLTLSKYRPHRMELISCMDPSMVVTSCLSKCLTIIGFPADGAAVKRTLDQ